MRRKYTLALSQTKGVLDAVFVVFVEEQLAKTNAVIDKSKIFFIFVLF
jgi:hypothetical protein